MVIAMRKFIGIIIGFVILLSGCSSDNVETQDVTLMLDYTPNTNHTGIYVAKELGYYEDVGINLDIIQPSDVATESVVASNQAEFGISYGENVAMFNQENDEITSIYGILSTNTSGFLSRVDSNITRPKDMEGKTYCGWGSDVETALLNTVVEADGGDPSKVETIVANSNLMSKDDCDFIWAYEAWDKVNLEDNDIDVNYIPITDYGVDWYTPVIITSNKLIASNPELVSNFIDATAKGYQYAIDNPEESAKILLSDAPELDETLVNNSQQIISSYYQTEGQSLGYQNPEIWTNFMNWMQDNGVIDNNASENMYTNQFIS